MQRAYRMSHAHGGRRAAGQWMLCAERVPVQFWSWWRWEPISQRAPGGDLHLTREGGHSHRRVVHAADLTGKEVERALLSGARAHPNITIMEHHVAVDLVCDEVAGAKHCLGVDVLDTRSHQMQRLVAPVTMLASGGAGEHIHKARIV